jgi:predicted RNase H-like HicB family nuclease
MQILAVSFVRLMVGHEKGEEKEASLGSHAAPSHQFRLSTARRGSKRMNRVRIVIERAKNNYSAYSPDLPGCVATGTTCKEAERNIHAAIKVHLRGLQEDSSRSWRKKN